MVGADRTDRAALLRYAGALEDASEHPIARAIAKAAKAELGRLPAAEGFTSSEGNGVRGIVDGHAVVLGRASLLADCGQPLGDELSAVKDRAEAEGKTAVVVGWDGRARGVLIVADTVKPTSAEAVRRFKGLGLTPILM
ncbi:HAD family hydrolase, partial [Mycobacterium sp. E188]|uniref:HAD family hydrolase n=1 Tax=Mycobacterium sp. E188 TaxID=1834130 RepID=UPI000B09B65A